MQRREHQVAGEARLHRDLRGLEVADLADHDHVRVLAEDRAQPACEGHLDLGVHLGLTDAVDVILDRILDRHDVAGVVVEALESGIERGRLSRAGWARDQQDPMGLVEQVVDQLLGARIHPEGAQVEPPGLLVEDAQHHALAVPRGDGRDAHVDRPAGDPEADAAVLRQALLRNVEPRHHLDARHDERRYRALRLQHLAQHAVHAEADHQAVLERLDVNVGGILLDRLGEHRVDQANDRRVVLAVEQVRLLGQLLSEVREIGGVVEPLDCLHRVRARLVGLAQQLIEALLRHALEPERAAQVPAHFGERLRGGGVAVGAFGHSVHDAVDEHAVALGECKRQTPLERLAPRGSWGRIAHGLP